MIFDEGDLANAVYIFSEDRELLRELNYSEFEALLDSYVPAVELANRELYAVYVELDSEYQIRNMVFFTVKFTSQGFIEQNWSLPLFQLASLAKGGPDLGNGPVGLVCASQCPDKQVKNFLWNPDLKRFREIKVLVDCVKRNRVAIHFRDADPEEKRRRREDKDNREKIEHNMALRLRREFDEELKEKVSKDSLAYEQRLQSLRDEHEQRYQDLKQLLDDRESLLAEEKRRNASLKDTIDGQAKKIQGLREYYEFKLEQALDNANAADDYDASAESDEALQEAVEEKTAELKELLQMRDVEILYRHEQEERLQREIKQLRMENSDLVANSGDQLLSKMLEKGISFVTYQPGAGHITLPLSDVARFLENPTAYVASHCGVPELHYNAWLDHYHVPVCQASGVDGVICGENIIRVEKPADFILGESDCCHRHSLNKTPRLKIAGGKGGVKDA